MLRDRVLSELRPKVGLVLSGGGARGAYEVGVIRYIRERLKCEARFDVITGSSVGAINGSYVAATCDRPRAQGRMLARMWNELSIDDMYRFGWSQVRSLPQVLFGKNLPKTSHGATLGGLVDSRFIETVVRSRIPWRGITENLHNGTLSAFACGATELATGLTTVFVHTDSGKLPPWPVDPGQAIVSTPIGPAHALASAAIPVLFPAVRVGDQMFVDGSLRQNTPIRPAMRLGANRLLVIGLRHKGSVPVDHARAREEAKVVYPNAVFMLGKMLNALMLDKLEADLNRISRTNDLIRVGTEIYGEDFSTRIGTAIKGRAARPYVPIQVCLVQPSQDLGEVAWDVMRRTRLSGHSGMMARWLRRMMSSTDDIEESDLASYVLFDKEYAGRLIELGYEDAAARHDDLVDLFC